MCALSDTLELGDKHEYSDYLGAIIPMQAEESIMNSSARAKGIGIRYDISSIAHDSNTYK